MKCKNCNKEMNKNGTRNEKQKFICRLCGGTGEELLSSNILVIPDLHIPFEHPKALKFCSDLKREFDCKKIIQLGDLADQYCFSKYLRDPDALSIRDEVKLAKERIKDWVSEFPILNITKGNHCSRLHKRLYEIGIPHDIICETINNIFGMPDTWTWTNELNINDIIYIHGTKTGPYAHITTANEYRRSIVMGHSHSTLAVQWSSDPYNKIFGVNAGCLIDKETYAFYYARESISKPVSGAIIMLDGKIPLCIPMEN